MIGWHPHGGISALLKISDIRAFAIFFSFLITWGHREKAAIYKPRKKTLTRSQPWWHLDPGLMAYWTVRKMHLCYWSCRVRAPLIGQPEQTKTTMFNEVPEVRAWADIVSIQWWVGSNIKITYLFCSTMWILRFSTSYFS